MPRCMVANAPYICAFQQVVQDTNTTQKSVDFLVDASTLSSLQPQSNPDFDQLYDDHRQEIYR
jgi:hypothetical protein